MKRREFIGRGAAALTGLSLPVRRMFDSENPAVDRAPERGNYMDKVHEAVSYRKIDLHNHINLEERNAASVDESCRRVGITRTVVSNILGADPGEIRENNDVVLDAMKAYPDRIMGSCYINPGFTRESLEEIDRCVDQGMVMVGELYKDYKINDPVYYPIIERCIDHKIPLMMHGAAHLGQWRPEYHTDNPLSTSTPQDFVDIGQRYPEAMIIYGHIGGGGDWEYACKVLREAPSVYAETSGSVSDEAMIDLAVESLGADRLLFATDVNYETGVGKVMHAKLTEEQRRKIFFDNFNNLLRAAGNHVD
ncbi:MAG: amidohydrolase family protein [Balneolaceae bacterium]